MPKNITEFEDMNDRKRNDSSTNITKWTTKKLKEEATVLSDMIYNIGCYGTRDFRRLGVVLDELSNRGIATYTHEELEFN